MNIRNFRVLLLAVAFTTLTALSVGAMAQTYGRFLDPLPPGMWQNSGGNNPAAPTQFDRNVMAVDKINGGTAQVGTIRFDYDTYDLGNGSVGAGLEGGFYLANGFQLKQGWNLGWVQIVRSTRSGANDWNLPGNQDGGWFPDATPQNPFYPFPDGNGLLNPAPPANPGQPTVGNKIRGAFTDYPNRFTANGNQFWSAELGLVALNKTADANGSFEMRVIGTFLWGFGVTGGTNPGVQASNPLLWGAPTQNFLDTLNTFYSGNPVGGSGGQNQVTGERHHFVYNTNVFIPTPATLALIGLGGLVAVRRRRAA